MLLESKSSADILSCADYPHDGQRARSVGRQTVNSFSNHGVHDSGIIISLDSVAVFGSARSAPFGAFQYDLRQLRPELVLRRHEF